MIFRPVQPRLNIGRLRLIPASPPLSTFNMALTPRQFRTSFSDSGVDLPPMAVGERGLLVWLEGCEQGLAHRNRSAVN